jgi:hypothetical protein
MYTQHKRKEKHHAKGVHPAKRRDLKCKATLS